LARRRASRRRVFYRQGAASLAAIDALIAEASIEAEQARANKDRTARRIAIARRNAATKRGLEFSSFSNNRRTAEEWARRHSESAN